MSLLCYIAIHIWPPLDHCLGRSRNGASARTRPLSQVSVRCWQKETKEEEFAWIWVWVNFFWVDMVSESFVPWYFIDQFVDSLHDHYVFLSTSYAIVSSKQCCMFHSLACCMFLWWVINGLRCMWLSQCSYFPNSLQKINTLVLFKWCKA